nr:MAG TPA: hypothetical protein [Caudoviricetes sp.]
MNFALVAEKSYTENLVKDKGGLFAAASAT